MSFLKVGDAKNSRTVDASELEQCPNCKTMYNVVLGECPICNAQVVKSEAIKEQ